MSDFFLHTVWTPEREHRAYEELDRTRHALIESWRRLKHLPVGATSGGEDTTDCRI